MAAFAWLRLDLQASDGKKLSENHRWMKPILKLATIMQEKVADSYKCLLVLPDVLSADEKFVYMKSQKFDFEGNRLEIGPQFR